MNRNINFYNKIIYGILAALCSVFLLVSVLQYQPYAVNAIEIRPQKIEFEGVYQTEGQAGQIKDGQIDAEHIGNEVTLRGHFKQKIEADTILFFRIYHIRVKMLQNGTEVYSHGKEGKYPEVYDALGDLWDDYALRQSISPEDTIELKLTHPAGLEKYRAAEDYNYFLDNIYSGSLGQMIRAVITDNWPHLLLSFFLIANGIALWIGAMILKCTKVNVKQIIFNGAYLFVVMGLWMLVGGRYLSVLTAYNGVILSADCILLFLMSALIFRYMGTMIESRLKLVIRLLEYTALLILVLYMFFQIAGIMDGYTFQIKIFLFLFMMVLTAFICLLIECMRYKRLSLMYMLSSGAILALYFLIGISEFLLAMQQNDKWCDIGIGIFALMQMLFIVSYIRQKFKEAEQTEAVRLELSEAKVQMMISQIRPHFVFNTLNAISALCLEDPQKADEAIVTFSKYLRANIAVLEKQKRICFEKEVELIKNYVSIEQMRFQGKISIKYALEFTDFQVPMLSIQPIVENAIKHGLSKKREGGEVTLKSKRENGFAVITIKDDGVGYDVNKTGQKQGSVGLRNIEARLHISSKARVTVESAPGAGTCVTVWIPIGKAEEEGEKNEGNLCR
ncbi:histidine kinase [Eubacterium sp. 1001713B170207_170306_E7]|uniref:histidine kinase n=1 Tax=Eubacterium sp. 1001713B170207_170306_E7 TaxID=2787097 RepID=UPI00189B4B9E|nr:histidine kinase [Eubacterium sp. 1001713B170207_170306_E7]